MAHDNQNLDSVSIFESESPDEINEAAYDDNEKGGSSAQNDISLESILAEYKGTAYIAGDKKTPSTILQEKTDKIVLEVAGGKLGQTQLISDR